MRVINPDEFKLDKERVISEIKQGAVFIHPTDTIYGLGCDATNAQAVKRIRNIKNKFARPFSIIAPSKQWILENCNSKGINKLPGPYTLIHTLKNQGCIAKDVNLGLGTLGIRIPDHWFSGVATEIGVPIVTTSANLVGEYYMTSLKDLNPKIKSSVDFIIYEGEKKGRPSTLLDFTNTELKVMER